MGIIVKGCSGRKPSCIENKSVRARRSYVINERPETAKWIDIKTNLPGAAPVPED